MSLQGQGIDVFLKQSCTVIYWHAKQLDCWSLGSMVISMLGVNYVVGVTIVPMGKLDLQHNHTVSYVLL